VAGPPESLRIHRGDGRTLSVPLTLEGAPWVVPVGAAVRCTAKRNRNDPDSAAVWTKTIGNGVTVAGSTVTVAISPGDTNTLKRYTVLEVDVQVTPVGGDPITVADFRVQVVQDISRTAP